jgi:ketosteroid isomerase-like protein
MTQPNVTQSNADLVRAASATFGRGDLGALRDQFFAENIVWHEAGTGPSWAGRVRELLDSR